MKKSEIESISKIGIIMYGLLGDVMLRTPVVNALKQIFPKSHITVIVDGLGFEIFKNNPYIDNIIVTNRDKKPKYKYILNKIIALKNVRAEKFSLLIDLYNNDSTKFLTRFSTAKYRLGFLSEKGQLAYNIMSDINKISSANKSMTMGYLKILYALKPTLNYSIQPILVVREEKLNVMKTYLDASNQSLKKLYVLNLGSRDMEKTFKSANYLKIVQYLYDNYSYIPAIVQNPSQEYLQEDFIREFLEPAELPYFSLKSLSIEDIGAVMSLVRFAVTPDTGLLHIASAVKLPTIGLFTYTPAAEVMPENNLFESLEQSLFETDELTEKEAYEKIDYFLKRLH